MARRKTRWERFIGWFTAPRIAALVLLALGIGIEVGGCANRTGMLQSWPTPGMGWEQVFIDSYASAATTLMGISIVVLLIDWLSERRAERQRIEREQLAERQRTEREQFAEQLAKQQLKAQLIREMAHPTDNGIALRAVRELRAHGWLTDGSLQGADLQWANRKGPI